jgi:hypothetical protein
VPNFNFISGFTAAKKWYDNRKAPEKMTRRPAMSAALADGDSLDQAATAKDQHPVADSGLLNIGGMIASQSALIVGLLYYFGWVRTQATFTYFDVDSSLIGYSTSDYVLRSVETAFQPFIYTALIALTLLGIHRLVIQRALDVPEQSEVWRGVRWFIFTVHAIGVGLTAMVIAGMLIPDRVGRPLGLLVPVSLIVSVALLGYVRYLRSTHPTELIPTRQRTQLAQAPGQGSEPARKQNCEPSQSFEQSLNINRFFVTVKHVRIMRPSPRVTSPSRIQPIVLLALGLLGIMWAVSLYAGQVGTDIASRLVAGLHDRSPVVIYSTERIAIAGTGVGVAEIAQPGNKYHYQYSGIRLLTHSTDKYVLVPMNWQRGRDRAFILRDNDSIRIDVGGPR